MSTFAFAHINVAAQHTAADQRSAIRAAFDRGDVVTFNEVHERVADMKVLAKRRGYGLAQPYPASGNAIAWNRDKFKWVHTHYRRVMVGGRRPRRRGPHRYGLAAVLAHQDTGHRIIVISTHLIAKAYTTHPWRRRLWRSSVANLEAWVRQLADTYPDAAIVLAGDFNRHDTGWSLRWLRQWPALPTYNRRRYDRLFTARGLDVKNLRTFTTSSDHRGLVASITYTPKKASNPEVPMRFVSRTEWGAAYAKGSRSIPGPVLGVTCHWEGPHMGDFPHSACAGKVRDIERFHAVSRGWSGIAYNALACPHGFVFEGRGTGVRSASNGTSDIGGNDQWYGVCYLGGQGDPFTDAGKQAMADAINWMRAAGGAGFAVNGHRDHHATDCPGDTIYRWAHGSHPARPTQEDDMPYRDWPQADRDALADDVAERVWRQLLSNTADGKDRHAGVALAQTHSLTVRDVRENAQTTDQLQAIREILDES